MVRRLVYVQVAVRQDRLNLRKLIQALDASPEGYCQEQSDIPAGLAPASGLTLVEVRYDNLV
jgi:tRNA U38,U39,U40 pseudouridine synthase TruA